MKVDSVPEVELLVAFGKLELFQEPLVSCPRCVSTEASGRISRIFSVTVNSDPEVDSPMECHGSVRVRQGGRMAVAAGGVF